MRWTGDLAYLIGLITTDGCLSTDGRHIIFSSKDIDQVETFANILGLTNKIALRHGSYRPESIVFRIQFGNIEFYKFLLDLGLTPNKSKTIGALEIPDNCFADFLRGSLDGDGYTYSYWDKRWRSSFLLYTGLVSASRAHLDWLNETILRLYGVKGHVSLGARVFQLKYAKRSSVVLLNKIYYKKGLVCLTRKYVKIQSALDTISKEYAGMLK